MIGYQKSTCVVLSSIYTLYIGQKRASGTKPTTESGHNSDPSHIESKDDVTCTLDTTALPDSKRPHIEDTPTTDVTTTTTTENDKGHNSDSNSHIIQSIVSDEVVVDIVELTEGGQNYDPDVVEMTRSTDEDPAAVAAIATTADGDKNLGMCVLYTTVHEYRIIYTLI